MRTESCKRKGRQVSVEVLEEKILKAKKYVETTKKAYDEAVDNLRALLDLRNELRKETLFAQLEKSKWSYEQVLKMLSSDPPEDD